MEVIRADASHTYTRPQLQTHLPPSLSLASLSFVMSLLKTLYEELIRAFTAKPSDLKKCVDVLPKLKVNSFATVCQETPQLTRRLDRVD